MYFTWDGVGVQPPANWSTVQRDDGTAEYVETAPLPNQRLLPARTKRTSMLRFGGGAPSTLTPHKLAFPLQSGPRQHEPSDLEDIGLSMQLAAGDVPWATDPLVGKGMSGFSVRMGDWLVHSSGTSKTALNAMAQVPIPVLL